MPKLKPSGIYIPCHAACGVEGIGGSHFCASAFQFLAQVFDVHRLDKVVMLLLSLTLLSFYPLQARLDVPEVVLQQIKSLNILDMELYRYAQSSFSKQHKQMMRQLKVSDNLFQDLFLASQYYCLCTPIPLVLDSHIHHITTIHAMLYCQKYRSLEHQILMGQQ